MPALRVTIGARGVTGKLGALALRRTAARVCFMPIVLAAAALCLSPSVHDGDTIRCGRERVRIANIEAPELPDSPKCQDRRRSYAWVAVLPRAKPRAWRWSGCYRGAG